MKNKNTSRLRRAKRTRMHIKKLAVPRLAIHRTNKYLYAQVFNEDGTKVLASASTAQASVNEGLNGKCNIEAASRLGQVIAERAKEAGVESVAFDRGGYRYHGRVKALAEAAREAGLKL